MEISALITAAVGALFAHAMVRLWRNRHVPGALPCLFMFCAVAAYVPGVLMTAPPVAALQAGYLAANLITPLLLIAVCEYAGCRPPGWPALRWLVVAGAAAVGLVDVAAEDRGVFQAIAAAPDLTTRSLHIQAARHGPWLATTIVTYACTAAIVGVALHALVTSPRLRRDMAVLAAVCAAVVGVDAAYFFFDFRIAGVTPTPFVLVAGLVAVTLVLYRSRMFDLRPIARSVLIESVKDGMLVLDDRRRIIDCNVAARELLRRPIAQVIGESAADLLPREFAALLQSTVHLRAELAAQIDGTRTWFEVDVTPLELKGRRAGHLIVARDISERHVVQDALEESRRALEAANARLVEQSVTDPLTGLKNRRFLFQRLNEELSRHRQAGTVVGLLVLDIDHFKAVNDTHGHPVGDEALVQVAATLTSSVRECDTVARLGGEEFAIIAVNADMDDLLGLAERIRRAVSRTPVARDTDSPMILTASIGLAVAGPDSRSADELFAEADRYLYDAKHRGRNRVVAPGRQPAARSAG